MKPSHRSGSDPRAYPDRPFLAVSAVVVRDGRVLVVREGEEETAIAIEPIDIAAYREVIARDDENRPKRHFVIVVFVARWRAHEAKPNEEIAEARWIKPEELEALPTTDGLAAIVARALERLQA